MASDLVRRAASSLRRNLWLSLMAIASVSVVLTLLAVFVLISYNARQALESWSRELKIVIYLDPAPSAAAAQQQLVALTSMAEIEKAVYVDPAEAMRRFRGRLGSDAILVDGIDSSVLPASIELQLKPPFRTRDNIKALAARLEQKSEWRDLHYGRDWLERYDALSRLSRLLGAGLGTLLLAAVFIIVATTIRLIFLSRRREIAVLRLVGATPAYIGLPFLFEGAFFGFAGALAALAAVHALYAAGLQQGLDLLLQALGAGGATFLPPLWQGALLAAGLLTGTVAGLVALRRLSRD